MTEQKKNRMERRWRRARRRLIGICCGLALGAGGGYAVSDGYGMTVQAAESSVIERVSISFRTTWGDAEEIPVPEISVSGTGVSLWDVQFASDPENWKPGKKVLAEINVMAEDGKYFPVSLGSSKCKVTGASFVSAKALDDNTLQVKAEYIPVTVLGDTQEAGWSSSSPKKAVWQRVSYAPGYSVILYGNDKVVKRMTVTTNSVDLGPYMKDGDKYYYYEVKAIPVTSAQKEYLKEGEFVLSEEQFLDEAEASLPEDQQGLSGSLKGDHYVLPNGSLSANTWKNVNGSWYYFDADGNRSRGWLAYGGRWYYLNGDGVMQTGWLLADGAWYYLGPEGDMQTGWIQPSLGRWYYLNGDGRMQTGWLSLNGNWYYLHDDGAMQTGWGLLAGNWYYFHPDGRMQTGWLALNGLWYYLNGDGVMQTGWLLSDGVWYYCSAEGVMQTGWTSIDGAWYYFSANGAMAVNTTIDGWQIGADGTAGKE